MPTACATGPRLPQRMLPPADVPERFMRAEAGNAEEARAALAVVSARLGNCATRRLGQETPITDKRCVDTGQGQHAPQGGRMRRDHRLAQALFQCLHRWQGIEGFCPRAHSHFSG